MLPGLIGQHAFSLVSMSFSFAVFLVGVLDGDFLVHKVLAVHVGDRIIGGFEVGKGYEPVAFGEVVVVSSDLAS